MGLESQGQVAVAMGTRASMGVIQSLPLPLHPHITLGKTLNFFLVFISMHHFMTGISLSPVAWLPFQLGLLAHTAGKGCRGVCNNSHFHLIPIPDAGDTGTPCAHPRCQRPLRTTLPLPWVMDAQWGGRRCEKFVFLLKQNSLS